MKHIICLIVAVLMAMLMVSCEPKNVEEPWDSKEQQKTEEGTTSENTLNEEVTSSDTTENTTDSIPPLDTAEPPTSENTDEWTGIY